MAARAALLVVLADVLNLAGLVVVAKRLQGIRRAMAEVLFMLDVLVARAAQ